MKKTTPLAKCREALKIQNGYIAELQRQLYRYKALSAHSIMALESAMEAEFAELGGRITLTRVAGTERGDKPIRGRHLLVEVLPGKMMSTSLKEEIVRIIQKYFAARAST